MLGKGAEISGALYLGTAGRDQLTNLEVAFSTVSTACARVVPCGTPSNYLTLIAACTVLRYFPPINLIRYDLNDLRLLLDRFSGSHFLLLQNLIS